MQMNEQLSSNLKETNEKICVLLPACGFKFALDENNTSMLESGQTLVFDTLNWRKKITEIQTLLVESKDHDSLWVLLPCTSITEEYFNKYIKPLKKLVKLVGGKSVRLAIVHDDDMDWKKWVGEKESDETHTHTTQLVNIAKKLANYPPWMLQNGDLRSKLATIQKTLKKNLSDVTTSIHWEKTKVKSLSTNSMTGSLIMSSSSPSFSSSLSSAPRKMVLPTPVERLYQHYLNPIGVYTSFDKLIGSSELESKKQLKFEVKNGYPTCGTSLERAATVFPSSELPSSFLQNLSCVWSPALFTCSHSSSDRVNAPE